ncbi:MAG: alpha-L-rhamnosidase N-terminal domain-containing protein, partial [Rikenellaceae bacterium]|nr:alpha-L-rhamnosidase N-terminal domain-containing protein [Rikenellaceae bacterium]
MRFFQNLILCVALFVALPAVADEASITPSDLTCEYDSAPVLDIQNPRLSWINLNPTKMQGAAQSAYRIRVATSPDFSQTVWDTGKVTSAESAFITYKGKPLQSRTSYWWQVMVWDQEGNPSAWSTPASWHMGLAENEWQGEWIGAPWQGEESYDVMGSKEVVPAPLLRKEFSVGKQIKRALFYGTGLGYFELYINGERVGEDYLSPNQTNYTTRPTLDTRPIVVTDPFEEYTVMYLTHDITSLLKQGDNAIGAILGNGFYDVVQYWPALGYGTPRFMGQVEIEYVDGSREVIASDTSWRAERSAIVSDQVYLGEHYDARLEHDGWATASYDDSSWAAVAKKSTPIGKLIPQNGPADRITKRYAPIEFEKKEDGTIRIKFEEETSGWLALKNIE